MNDKQSLKGKTAWITGGKRIGKRIAEMLAQHGANIILTYNNSSAEAEKTIRNIGKYKIRTLIVQCDVSSQKSSANAVKKIKKEFKKIDMLVLMASVFDKIQFNELKPEDFQKNFDVHVIGTFWPVK